MVNSQCLFLDKLLKNHMLYFKPLSLSLPNWGTIFVLFRFLMELKWHFRVSRNAVFRLKSMSLLKKLLIHSSDFWFFKEMCCFIGALIETILIDKQFIEIQSLYPVYFIIIPPNYCFHQTISQINFEQNKNILNQLSMYWVFYHYDTKSFYSKKTVSMIHNLFPW